MEEFAQGKYVGAYAEHVTVADLLKLVTADLCDRREPLGPNARAMTPNFLNGVAEGEGFEPPWASRPGGFQVHCLAS